ncbi:hypothetical protein [Mycobacteroides abscessus]|uniref:hypothetical protein n=1 Tax=Mycobacteroides abscessus TaxID=36809 RepID=UPI0009CCBF0A|nr:hypothetical protein [Mycobacteroides abscessus]SKK25220.1 Uncharacterised protein [Mycobacteroides abscessus subsp. massiliense]SKK30136.1 Uncharacterised protein [Mycobacteroides abscessus subsp. massiliense]SKK50712.1 Uncharacterised protein [Mycobacteroides abscessus subsp. massiliense]
MSTTLDDQDADTYEAIACRRPSRATPLTPATVHWRPSKLDVEMAAAAVGVGALSGLLAGGAMWWATGQHPRLAAISTLIGRNRQTLPGQG